MLEIRDPDGKVVSIRDYNQEMIEEYNRQGTGFYARRRTNRLVVVLSTLCVLLSSVLVGVLIERGGQTQTQTQTELSPSAPFVNPNPSTFDVMEHMSKHVNDEFMQKHKIPKPPIGPDVDLTKQPEQRVSK